MHGGAGSLGVQHDGQGHIGNIFHYGFRPAQNHSGRGYAHVFHCKGAALEGRIHNGPHGYATLQQVVRLDDNARGLHVDELKGAEARSQVFGCEGHHSRAFLDVGEVYGLDELALGYGAQQRFRPAQTHRGLGDKAVGDDQIGRDTVIVQINVKLGFQPVPHADHIPHAHSNKDGR